MQLANWENWPNLRTKGRSLVNLSDFTRPRAGHKTNIYDRKMSQLVLFGQNKNGLWKWSEMWWNTQYINGGWYLINSWGYWTPIYLSPNQKIENSSARKSFSNLKKTKKKKQQNQKKKRKIKTIKTKNGKKEKTGKTKKGKKISKNYREWIILYIR